MSTAAPSLSPITFLRVALRSTILLSVFAPLILVLSLALDDPQSAFGEPMGPAAVAEAEAFGAGAGEATGSADGGANTTGASEKPSRSHWSPFDLALTLLSLFISLGLVAYLGLSTLHTERLQEETWERVKNPQALEDVESVASTDLEMFPDPIAPPTTLNRFCTGVCVGLTLVSIIIFFATERIDASLVLFDKLSPLFAVLFVLIVFGAVLALLSGSRSRP